MSSATEHFNKTAESYEAATGGATRELGEHAISLMTDVKPLTSESRILDNACGTGVVTDIILQSAADANMQPEIHAVDGAENMVDVVRRRFPSAVSAVSPSHPNKVHAAVMRGERLRFPDASFTHSVTSLGLMFFTDAGAGAREIARTLRPDGGVAVVTGWAAMGHVDVIRAVQARIRPDDAPFEPPFSDAWLDPGHTEAVLAAAGLDVQASTRVDVHMGCETAEGVARLLTRGFGAKAFESWSDDEKAEAAVLIDEIVRERAVPFTRPSGSGVGIKSTGTIFVARRGSGRVSL
ncbi:Methyltransferase tpcH [Colletotrichum spinosum]|uniref:Methyltransferase tpcH n=1 Tax=Colletotrichum spinosum TaxID=1347390 RepID=A0A4R8QUR9_9PEZI|nr:Methyltransferase tpcH [Colletotrichum spinosum]